MVAGTGFGLLSQSARILCTAWYNGRRHLTGGFLIRGFRFAAAGSFALVIGMTAAGEQGGAPTAAQVLARYVQALGGREAILKVSTREMSGTFQLNGQDNGTVEVVYKAPNRYRSLVRINGYGVVDSGHDAAGGWERSPEQPLRAQSGADLARTRRELDLHKAAKLAQLFRSITFKGKGKAGERDAWLLVAVPAEGYPETMYFDFETGLLVRVDLQIDTDSGPVAVERHYDDYRDVGGVKVAHRIHFLNPGTSYTLHFTSVAHNVPVDDARLARPAN